MKKTNIIKIKNFILKDMGITETVRWVTPKEAAALLGISTRSLVRYKEQGLIRYIVLPGGHYRYSLEDILKIRENSGK